MKKQSLLRDLENFVNNASEEAASSMSFLSLILEESFALANIEARKILRRSGLHLLRFLSNHVFVFSRNKSKQKRLELQQVNLKRKLKAGDKVSLTPAEREAAGDNTALKVAYFSQKFIFVELMSEQKIALNTALILNIEEWGKFRTQIHMVNGDLVVNSPIEEVQAQLKDVDPVWSPYEETFTGKEADKAAANTSAPA